MISRANLESVSSSIEYKEIELIEAKASLNEALDLEHEGNEKLKSAEHIIALLSKKR